MFTYKEIEMALHKCASPEEVRKVKAKSALSLDEIMDIYSMVSKTTVFGKRNTPSFSWWSQKELKKLNIKGKGTFFSMPIFA